MNVQDQLRQVARYVLLAQVASQAGKHELVLPEQHLQKALDLSYGIKSQYIAQAISHANKLNDHIVRVSQNMDNIIGMWPSPVVYFDFPGIGQVSFHTPYSKWKVPNTGRWNGIRGGSVKCCRRLAKKFHLPFKPIISHFPKNWSQEKIMKHMAKYL